MEKSFTLIFKYQPFYFRNGDLGFQWSPGPWLGSLVVVVAVGVFFLLYRTQIRRFPGFHGWLLFGLRAISATLIIGLLMRPTLTLPTLAPGEGVVAILADNSRSMGLKHGGRPRGELVKDLLSNGSRFMETLRNSFHVKQYRFDTSVSTLEEAAQLDWSGDQTDVNAGLEKVLADSRNIPLNGVILISDGANTSIRDDSQALAELQRRGIPVHAVGIGPNRWEKDVELVQVRVPKNLLPDTAAVARLTLRHSGYGGAKGRLEIREAGVLVDSVEVQFPRDSDISYAELRLYPKSEGISIYDFRLGPMKGEQIIENNSKSALVRIRDSRPRVLYVEGQPRWEFKFLRRALSDDRHIRFETLLRTALNKFYRQGIQEETVLAGGFPAKKEELYQYEGILIGNVESAFFSYSQMELLRDFVGHRGGGVLMLGGNSTLSSGGYQNTPLEEMLPVSLKEAGAGKAGDSYQRGHARVALTQYGENHPALELARDKEENRELWGGLPDLIDRNLAQSLKYGATVLIQLDSESLNERKGEPLLVSQRYGRGLAVAFLTGSSWRWQMLQDHEDKSYETFWKQIIRWLVLSAEDPITAATEREVYSRGHPVSIRAEVRDAAFTHVSNAKVEAVITSSEGEKSRVALRWNPREDGVYFAEWSPEKEGMYQVQVDAVSATSPQESLGQAQAFFIVTPATSEYFDSGLKEDYLKRLSEETGGRYYTVASAERLPTEIRYVESQASVIEVLDLWDMPFNLILLLSLLLSEWFLRRRWGIL